MHRPTRQSHGQGVVVRKLIVLVALLLVVPALPGQAAPPIPEAGFASPAVPTAPCTPEAGNGYERAAFAAEGWRQPQLERYPGACRRLRFTFGPIVVKPGQNDVLLQPVTVEKPWYDGWLVRFDPDLVTVDGSVPPIDQLHLHHAVWLSQPSYGSGPFAASGEEKTIFSWPRGYGMPVQATDQWQLLYMVHSAVPNPTQVFITYDIDYIPRAEGTRLGLKTAYPLWLDVGALTSRSAYPVFNVQRKYGGTDGRCTWPKERCADFDPFGQVSLGQGEPGNGTGYDWRFPRSGGTIGRFPSFTGGTLIFMGGHLHPGGLADEVDLVRNGRSRRIYTGEALYWDRKDPRRPGGPPTSWDFSMTVVGLPRWGVRVRPGDVLRLNATYDTTRQSTFENMGIVVALLAPDDADGPTAAGLDPFTARIDGTADCRSGGIRAGALCPRGQVTHGHMPETENFGGPDKATRLDAKRGAATSRVDIAAFTYLPGDLGLISMHGIPTVKLDSNLKFVNEDMALAGVLHTVTACAYPCTGTTGTAFPLANGRASSGRDIDFDSAELGYGPPIGAAKNAIDWDLRVSQEQGFQRGGTYTYFCRVHPFMRGAFEVL